MTDRIFLKLDWRPKAKSRPRGKAGQRSYTPKTTKDAEAALALQIMQQMDNHPPMEGPLSVTTKFTDTQVLVWIEECDPSETKGKRGDLDNYVKLVWDALNGLAFEDDKQIVRMEAQWR